MIVVDDINSNELSFDIVGKNSSDASLLAVIKLLRFESSVS